jgi:putative two-component system response regulator
MPGLNGYEVCRRLKQDPKTRLIPIIMATSLNELPDKLRAIELGVDDFLIKPVHISELTTRVRSFLSLKRYTDELEHASRVLESMALIVERRDGYTGEHCKRVGEYAATVGRRMGLDDESVKLMGLGAVFHDLGKIAVPDGVLRKPGALDSDELAIMRTHPGVGEELCKPMRTMEKVLPMIRHHHEKLDGSGYPDGLSGSQIPIAVRIISVVDVYDALATERPYKKAFPREKCISILRDEAAKGWWDREVVETLITTVSI